MEKNNLKKEIFSWIKTIILALCLAFLINNFIIVNATVPTGSMETTIMSNDRIIASRLSYYFKEPERGDIVVFKYPDDPKVLYVKRIIGVPGDKVEIYDGRVYINNSSEPLEDEYVTNSATGDYGPFEVPEGCYFMLGDNRDNSLDSRFWVDKYVEKNEILGKVFFKYYPGFKVIK